MFSITVDKSLKGVILLTIILLISTACTQKSAEGSPEVIAAYPKTTPIAIAPPLPKGTFLVYQLYLEMSVSDVETAASRASDMAYQHGGYLVSTHSWFVDGRQNTTLVLAVPTMNLENLRHDLHSLGTPVNENRSGDWIEPHPRDQMPYSHITLQLRPKLLGFPPINPIHGWDPVRTFQNAFSVFLRIFGFLADITIWLVVVVAPFVLLVWLGILLARRIATGKQGQGSDQNQTE